MLTGRLLDAGCGTGEHAILAARYGADALGIDVSPRAIARAQRKAARRMVGAQFRVADVLQLAAHPATFDTVVDSGLFHVFDDNDRDRYVSALHAATRAGSHLHLMCFSDRQAGDWGPRRVSEAELRAAFAVGWQVGSLERDRFELSPGVGILAAEAWLADLVRLPSG
jgi:cyclopropane fatty-acyl-phospholipid synthase-like methyltransferase